MALLIGQLVNLPTLNLSVILAPESSTRNVISPTSNYIPLVVQGYAAQTANLFQVNNSLGTEIASFDSSGNISANNLDIASGKTFTVSNTLTLAGIDGSTLNIGTGGTLGSAAYTSSSAYEVPLTFSTGLTRTVNTVTVNTSQNIEKLTNLTTNGFVKTSGGNGTLSVDTSTYLTANQTITLSGDVSGSGSTAITTTIGSNKVTLSMMATMATASFLGRSTASTGNVEVLSAATAAGLLTHNNLSGLTSGDPHTQYIYTSPASSARNTITAQSSTVVPQTWVLASSQTADALNINNSSSTILTKVNANGYVGIGYGSTALGAALDVQISSSSIFTSRFRNNQGGNSAAVIQFVKTRSSGVVTSGDKIGEFNFLFHDGTLIRSMANFGVRSSGAPANNNSPCQLWFGCTPGWNSTDGYGDATGQLIFDGPSRCATIGENIGTGGTTAQTSATLAIITNTTTKKTLVAKAVASQSTSLFETQNSSGTALLTVSQNGDITSAPAVRTNGSPNLFTVTGPAHTTLTASTEATDINFNLARTVQFAAGALTTQRAARLQAPTYGFASSSTLTEASTLAISNEPQAGTNATITNAYALNIEAGGTRMNGCQVVKRTTTAADYTILKTDYLVAVTSTAAARAITLPTAVNATGKVYVVKDESGGAGTNNITINTTSAQTIDGASTKTITTNFGSTMLYSDGANWLTF